MLNLLRVELVKLFTGKTFWITMAVYLVSILGTFIPLSYISAMEELYDITESNAMTLIVAEDFEKELALADEMMVRMKNGGNFVQEFYTNSSGSYIVVLIFVSLYILFDLSRRTTHGTLLCGYSRRQVYLAKLGASIAGTWLFLLLGMVLAVLLGIVFYGMRLDGSMVGTILQILLAQWVTSVEYAAVFVAFAFVCGNAWCFLFSILTFVAIPSIPLVYSYLTGTDQTFVASYLPSFVAMNGVGGIYTINEIAAVPELWTGGLVFRAALVWIVLTAGITLLGIRRFEKKQL